MDGEPLISHGVDDASGTDIDGIPSEKVTDLPMAILFIMFHCSGHN